MCYRILYCVMLIAAIISFFPFSIVLGSDSTDIIELEKMVVQARMTSVFSSDIIDSAAILSVQDAKTVDGLLVNLAGIDVQRTSPTGGKGTGVSIRGFSESQSMILLNGRPVNGSGVMGGHYVDWSSLSKEGISEIEVIRGPKSAEYGNTLGGTVNIITKEDINMPAKTTVSASYSIFSPEHTKDIYENRNNDISITHFTDINEALSLNLFAGYAKGEPFLRNNYFNRANFGGELNILLPLKIKAGVGLQNTIHYRGFAIKNNVDSLYYDSDFPESKEDPGGGPGIKWKGGNYYFGDRSYWKNIRTQADFFLKKKFKDLMLSARVYINDQDRTEYFYAVDDTNKLVLERFAKPEDHTWGWNVKANHNITKDHTLRYGFEGISLRYGSSDIRHIDTAYFRFQPQDGSDETIRASDRYSAFVQGFLNFLNRVEITPGVRYDYYLGLKRDTTVDETPFHGVSPNAGIAVRTWKGGELALHGAYTYRFPTCPELYWYYGGYSFDDRNDLLPEKAMQAELGISQALSREKRLDLRLGVRGYYYYVNDYIRTIFGYKPSRLIYNIDNVVLNGVEFEASTEIMESFCIWGNYTFQITEKTGDDFDSSMVLSDRLPELPEHKANMGIEYRPANGATVGLSMRFVGEKEVIEGNLANAATSKLTHVDPFVTFRLFGTYPVLRKEKYSAKLKLGVDNLFNTEYEEEPGIPMPGITTTGAVEISF